MVFLHELLDWTADEPERIEIDTNSRKIETHYTDLISHLFKRHVGNLQITLLPLSV